MVWALRFDGVNEAAETGVHVISDPVTDNFYVEIDIDALSGDGTYVAQNTSNTESSRGFQLGASSGLGGFFVVIGGSRTDFSITPSVGLWRFEFDGSTYSALKDSSPQGSGVLSRGSNSEPLSTLCFGARHAGSNSSYGFFQNMDLKSCEIGLLSGSAIGDWDASASDNNSNPPVLIDTVGGNDATGINMTDANWIDLGGGNEYVINGDSSVTVIPSSDFSIQRNYTISGDVPVELTPVANFLLNRSYNIDGQSSLELSPNSGFELNREYTLSGDVPLDILPNSETIYSSGNSINGEVTYSVIPTALFEINRSYSIDGLTNIEFTVQSDTQKNINVVVDGNVPIEITPSANFQFGIENIIDGDVNFDITPDSSFVFNRQYILNGSVGINLTPDSETETTKNYIYNGQSEVSFSVEGEFEFDGQKLINGDVQINIAPNSEMVLDRVQVIKDPLFTLSVEDEVITLSVESSVEVIYAVAR